MIWMSTEGKFYLVSDDINGEKIISPRYDTFAGMVDWLEATGWKRDHKQTLLCVYVNDTDTVICGRVTH